MQIRSATPSDAAAMLAIYTPVVNDTAISFELEPPGVEQFEERLRKYLAGWVALAAQADGEIIGYAYGSTHRERAAYRWSVETTVYVAGDARRRGVGTSLYRALLPALAQRGYCNAFAGVTLPNPGSIAVHEKVGFRGIGTFPNVGYKFGRWHDVGWLHCPLRSGPPGAELPQP